MNGKVYIVGAGPGDIGLFTIKGLRVLKMADVVVYDFHLNAQILNYVNHDAEFIYAGKRGGFHSMSQDEINQTLINKAREGLVVCRLKGGDPFVFGRGGEEAEALARAGIEFEVVPGVSSAIAAPAYAGIPLTHRLYSSSFAVVSGYEDPTKGESSINWEKLSTGVGTIVFLMAIKNISLVSKRLIDNGRSPDTPVAVIRWGTRAEQKTVVADLKSITDVIRDNEIKPPAVMVVGDVVRLRDNLKWFENKPLFGHRILITREHSGGFERLEELGAEVIGFPTIKIAPPLETSGLDLAIDNIESYHWLIFTSANGVKFFFKRFFEKGRDIRELKGIRICTIGAKTASEVNRYGIKVDLMPEEFNAEGLIDAFISAIPSDNKGVDRVKQGLKGMRFLLPRAEVGREALPEGIRSLGGEIDVPPAYRATKPDTHGKRLKRALREGKITIATFTSAATFNNLLSIMGNDAIELLRDVVIAVIGPVTKMAVEKAGLRVHIMPQEATVDAMIDEIIRWVGREKKGS